MQYPREKVLKDQIAKDLHFIEKMKMMGEKWCSYLLIAEELENAAARIKENSEELENLDTPNS